MVRVTGRLAHAFALAVAIIAGLEAGQAQTADIPLPVPNPVNGAHVLPDERRIALKHHWTREEVKVVYRIGDVYQPDAMAAINRLMRDWRCDKTIAMDPKLVDMLYELHQDLGGLGFIRVVSAYRSEGYNASLLRAGRTVDPDSQHTLGRAADVIFPGVKADRVRAAAEAKGLGGVGYYPFSGPVFVHVDTGPVRHWVETDPRVRRAMALAAAPRARFVLDCALTVDQVFEKIPADRAYAALPPGASITPRPEIDLLRTSLAGGSPGFRAMSARRDGSGALHSSIQADHGPACIGDDPLARLSLPSLVAKAARRAPKALVLQKRKVKAQVRAARRPAPAAKTRPFRKTASVRTLIRKR